MAFPIMCTGYIQKALYLSLPCLPNYVTKHKIIITKLIAEIAV